LSVEAALHVWKTVLLLAAVMVIALPILGWSIYASIAAQHPGSWLKVRPGMTSDEARRLLGPPWADGRDLKIVDRWRQTQNGVEMHLDLWFENENKGDTPIARANRWKHFFGENSEEAANPPWPEQP
jgi:hypothetical protein